MNKPQPPPSRNPKASAEDEEVGTGLVIRVGPGARRGQRGPHGDGCVPAAAGLRGQPGASRRAASPWERGTAGLERLGSRLRVCARGREHLAPGILEEAAPEGTQLHKGSRETAGGA